jgi:LysM repeat protein
MKLHSLPVKRRPVPKGIFKRLRAVTGNRKQRVAATATGTAEMESEDSSSKISRALTIIFLIHIVAIGLIFVHQRFLDGRTPDEPKTAQAEAQEPLPAAASAPPRLDLPRIASGEKPYFVKPGDNYSRIAAAVGVEESELRLINKHVDILPGLMLKIPPKRIVAVDPPEVAALRNQGTIADTASTGLVDAVDVRDAPRAKLVKTVVPKSGQPAAEESAATSGKTYVVQNGDSIWRIANRFKVNQNALMKANGISDARKIKVGTSLSIPN